MVSIWSFLKKKLQFKYGKIYPFCVQFCELSSDKYSYITASPVKVWNGFITPKTLVSLSHTFPLPLATTAFMSVPIILPFPKCPINGNRTICTLWVGRLALSMIHWRVLHVVVCISNLLLSLPSNSLLYWCTTVIHSLVEGYLGHLEFLAVTVNCTVNKKTVNICRFLLNISFSKIHPIVNGIAGS